MARNRRRYTRLVGSGPWECFLCYDEVLELGKHRDQGHVHHLDENEENDDPSNLAVVHADCHNILHQAGRPARATQKGGTHTWGDKISEGLRGHAGARASKTPEGRAKFSQIAKERGNGQRLNSIVRTCECGYQTTNAGAFARYHRNRGHKEVMQ
jgi:hypothetical protein